MNSPKVHLTHPDWEIHSFDPGTTAWARGCLLEGDQARSWKHFLGDLTTALESGLPIESLKKSLENTSGFFAFILSSTNITLACVDHVRSIPLFYAQSSQGHLLSDCTSWIHAELPSTTTDAQATEQFKILGYVPGTNTLLENIHQATAGQVLLLDNAALHSSPHSTSYFVYEHTTPETHDEAALKHEFLTSVRNSFDRLRRFAGDRQIVVPLSGGYDSRLVLAQLREMGLSNVLTFSYGTQTNLESCYSKKISDSLGYPWEFIPYTPESWKESWFTQLGSDYCRMASNHSSLPHAQDWLAVKQLKDQRKIQDGCIFVPGHSGDFVAGSHLPDKVFSKNIFTHDELTRSIFDRHFRNVLGTGYQSMYSKCKDWIKLDSTHDARVSAQKFASLYEQWDWRERQAKYIINSVRAYEFFGCDWWLPLWDREFLAFWAKVPLQLRKHRRWYIERVQEIYSRNAKSEYVDLGNAEDPSRFYSKLMDASAMTPLFLRNPLIKIKRRIEGKSKFLQHPCAFSGLIPEGYLEKYAFDYNFVGMFSDLYIGGQWSTNEPPPPSQCPL